MSQKIKAKFAIAYDVNNNITSHAFSPDGNIEFSSDTDTIVTFDNEIDFKAAMQPIVAVINTPSMKLTANAISDISTGKIKKGKLV